MNLIIPSKWLNLIRRVLGLQPGRWVILLDVGETGCNYEVIERGKTEK